MALFEKKNPLVEAIQYTGNNLEEIKTFLKGSNYYVSRFMGSIFLEEFKEDPDAYTSAIHENFWVLKEDSGKVTVASDKTFQRDYKEKQ